MPQKIELKNGKTFTLNLPAEYEIIPAAEGLKRVRFFAKSPDGRIFVTDMYNLTDNAKGAVYILDEFDAKTGKFGKVVPYMTNLKNPNSVHTAQMPAHFISLRCFSREFCIGWQVDTSGVRMARLG